MWLGCGIASFILLVQVICYNSQFLIIYFKYYEYLYNMYDDEYLNRIEIEIEIYKYFIQIMIHIQILLSHFMQWSLASFVSRFQENGT